MRQVAISCIKKRESALDGGVAGGEPGAMAAFEQ
jgi:hypothetical protein